MWLAPPPDNGKGHHMVLNSEYLPTQAAVTESLPARPIPLSPRANSVSKATRRGNIQQVPTCQTSLCFNTSGHVRWVPVTMAWRVLRLPIEGNPAGTEGSYEYIE
jgi:hypothetical protein